MAHSPQGERQSVRTKDLIKGDRVVIADDQLEEVGKVGSDVRVRRLRDGPQPRWSIIVYRDMGNEQLDVAYDDPDWRRLIWETPDLCRNARPCRKQNQTAGFVWSC